MRTQLTLLAALLLAPSALTLCLGAGPAIANGGMDGAPVDHSEGKGFLVTPPSWTPVNVDTARSDRLSVEVSDRAGAGQCLRVKALGSDAGVYQSLAPLEQGKTYLVSAWVKRLSGTLAVEAYPFAWGPAVKRRLDSVSTGWTHLTVGLTPVDGGAHLYLVAAPEAEFLIDEVEIHPATVQVSLPKPLPYDFGSRQSYRLTVTPVATESALPASVLVQPISDTEPDRVLAPPQPVKLTGTTAVEVTVPVRAEGSFCVQVTNPQTGAVLSGSPVVPLVGDPWIVRSPFKDSLFASLDYKWPMRVTVLTASRQAMAGLEATAEILDGAGKTVRQTHGALSGSSLAVPVDGRGLAAGSYHLRLTVRTAAGRLTHQSDRALRILPPAPNEVVCAPNGDTLVNGRRFFPVGLYWVLADPMGWKPGPGRKTDDLHELHAAGFNTLHTYAFEHNDANDTDDNAVAYLDMAQEFGFKVMMGLRRDWYQGQELNAAAIEQRVRRLRSHPALLCWTLWDEPDSNVSNVSRVQAVYDLVNRLDPYHPAMPVFMSGGGRPFREAADLNLFDCYPGAGNAGLLPGVFERAQGALPDKPMWYVAQAYQQGDKLPSGEDMRLYWQHALDAGAKAIFWYGYGGDARGWDSIRITPEHFATVKRVVRELADEGSAR